MRTLLRISVTALLAFMGITGASYFLLSDGHGVSLVADGIKRVGWPFLIFEKGGYIYRREFHLAAALGDFAVAVCLGAGLCFVWNLAARKDSFWRKGP
jgi:hypothetical protein